MTDTFYFNTGFFIKSYVIVITVITEVLKTICTVSSCTIVYIMPCLMFAQCRLMLYRVNQLTYKLTFNRF